MNGRVLLLASIGAVVLVCLLLGDDLWRPIQGLWGDDPTRAEREATLLTSEEGVQDPRLAGRGDKPPAASPPARGAGDAGGARGDGTRSVLRTRARGQVRLPDGRSAAGVRILLEGPAGRFEVRTGADGTFSQEVPVGVYRAVLVSDGVGALVVPALVVDGAAGDGALPDYQLQETVEIEVLVRRTRAPTEDGSAQAPIAVPGLSVRLVNEQVPEFSQEAVTGGGGLALFSGVLPQPHIVVVALDETTSAHLPIQVEEGQRTHEVRLPAFVPVSGMVRAGVDGPGVRGAVVFLAVRARVGETRYEARLATLYDGSFEGRVPQGQGEELSIRAPGFAPWPAQASERATTARLLRRFAGTDPVRVDAALVPGISVVGRFEAAAGDRMPEAGLAFRMTGTGGAVEGRSEADGSFHVPDLAAGAYRLEVHTPGWIAATLGLRLDATMAPEHDLGAVAVRPLRVLSGRVLDAQGRGVAAARVRVWPRPSGGGAPRLVFSDAAGAWSLPDPPVAGAWDVQAAHGARTSKALLVFSAQPGPFDLVLQDTAALHAEVRDGGSEGPVSAVSVRVDPQGIEGAFGQMLETDAEGRASFEGLLPGRWLVTVRSPEHRATPAQAVQLAAGQTLPWPVVLDPGLVFAGQCVDESGAPLADVTISVSGEDLEGRRAARSVNSDADGRFHVGGLPAGTFRLRALRSGYRLAERTGLQRSDEHIRFTLQRQP